MGLQRLQRSHNQATRTVIVQPGLLAFSPPVFLHLEEIIDSENNIKEIFFLKGTVIFTFQQCTSDRHLSCKLLTMISTCSRRTVNTDEGWK